MYKLKIIYQTSGAVR